jgi:membrane associated rhomboid family serine protease
MIPIRDDAPRSGTPYVTYFLLWLNVIVFLFEVGLGPDRRTEFIFQFGVIPANITHLRDGILAVSPAGALLPLISSMFLHASWLHLIANMWALWIFGDNIEDYLGHFLYLLLYLVAGLAASAAHVFFNAGSIVPSVGASGAIAGIMGAYFVLFPSARVLTIVPILFFFVWLPAWVVLGYWFVAQFLSGAATAIASTSSTQAGGVAVWAHVGGFIAGILLIRVLPQRADRFSYH